MGCSTNRVSFEEIADTPLDYNLDKLPIGFEKSISEFEILNEYYKKASLIIEMIEVIRESLIDKLDELIYKTGAYIFKDPDIISIIKCVYYKVSQENMGNIKKADIRYLTGDPFLEIKGEHISPEMTLIINMLTNYISDVFSLQAKIKQVDKQIPLLVYIVSEKNENLNFINNSNNDKMEKLTIKFKQDIIKIIKTNNYKIKAAIELFPDLFNFIHLTIEKCKFEFDLLKKDNSYLQKIDQVGQEAYVKNINHISEISQLSKKIHEKYKYIGEDIFLSSQGEGKSRFKELIKIKKQVRQKYITKKNLSL